eukprot:TRINITY_DN56968_c0_g1_i1.p1 TRINITY_DN56968_c0_g1~~TRINITY_DN56968_c0_g1_i1.p1  ORF type:complete len:120 (-),score=34.95 TRINITY_DN56968_c0_g1_i1:40-399(-)
MQLGACLLAVVGFVSVRTVQSGGNVRGGLTAAQPDRSAPIPAAWASFLDDDELQYEDVAVLGLQRSVQLVRGAQAARTATESVQEQRLGEENSARASDSQTTLGARRDETGEHAKLELV